MIRASGRAGRLVAFDLLEHPSHPVSARVVAERTGLAYASVNDILRFLRFHGALAEGDNGRVRWRRLAELTSRLRLPEIVPTRSVTTHLALDEVSSRLAKAEVTAVLGFTTAANRWAFFEPDPSTHLIVGPRQSKKAAETITDHEKRTRGGSRVHFYEDDITALQTEKLTELILTSRLQTWIDLHSFPHAAAHAAFLQQVVEKLYPESKSR